MPESRSFGDHQRLVDQRSEQVEHPLALDSLAGADLLGRLEGKAAGEHRQAAKQRSLVVGEQLVAPVDRGAQGLKPGQGRARPAGQEAEAIREAGCDLLDREHPHPGGGELDRQRQPVELGADLQPPRRRPRSLSAISGRASAARSMNSATASEAPLASAVRPRSSCLARQRQRRHPPLGLAGDPERGAAGGQDHQLGGGRRGAPRRPRRTPRARCSQLSSTTSALREAR